MGRLREQRPARASSMTTTMGSEPDEYIAKQSMFVLDVQHHRRFYLDPSFLTLTLTMLAFFGRALLFSAPALLGAYSPPASEVTAEGVWVSGYQFLSQFIVEWIVEGALLLLHVGVLVWYTSAGCCGRKDKTVTKSHRFMWSLISAHAVQMVVIASWIALSVVAVFTTFRTVYTNSLGEAAIYRGLIDPVANSGFQVGAWYLYHIIALMSTGIVLYDYMRHLGYAMWPEMGTDAFGK